MCLWWPNPAQKYTFLFEREFQQNTLTRIYFNRWHLRWSNYQSQGLFTAKVRTFLLPLKACCATDILRVHRSSSVKGCVTENRVPIFRPYLQVGSVIFGYIWAVTLTQHCDFLLNVLYLIFSFFQINDFYGNHFLSPKVNAFEHLTERALSNFLQFCKKLFWIRFQVL